MARKGGQIAVVTAHDAEPFVKGSAVVAGGHAFVQIVDQGEMGIVKRMAFFMMRMHQSKSAENR